MSNFPTGDRIMKKSDKNPGTKNSNSENEVMKPTLVENKAVLESLKNDLEYVKEKYEALQRINESLNDTNELYKSLYEVLQDNIKALHLKIEVLQKDNEYLQEKYEALLKDYEFLQQDIDVVKSNNGYVKEDTKVSSKENEVLQANNGAVKSVKEIRTAVYEYVKTVLKDDIVQEYVFTPLTDIVMLFLEKDQWTGAGIRNKIDISRSTANRYMQKLKKTGLITYSGSPRWKGRYTLTKKGKSLLECSPMKV